MSARQIEPYQDSAAARAELISWLMTNDPDPLTVPQWQRRLAHWWDENPFAPISAERGTVLRCDNRIVGFMACIPACYAVKGTATPATIASTWRVDVAHRNASLPMFMWLRRLGTRMIIADTTPSPEVQALMERTGLVGLHDVQKRYVALGWPGRLWHGRSWPALREGLRLTRDPGEVSRIAAPCASVTTLEKWITPEYLRWFAAATMRRHEFIGVIDAEGCLSSYLFLTPANIRGVPAWMEIDHFTTRPAPLELHALIAALVRQPGLLGWRPLLSLAAFPGDPAWETCPALYQRPEKVSFFFMLPDALKSLPKRTLLAEGDKGM